MTYFMRTSKNSFSVLYQKMGIISIPKLLKTLKWLLICTLLLSSFWFMSDAYEKFQSKATSFRVYSKERTQVPTTTLCFAPYAKPTALSDYNMTWDDFENFKFPDDENATEFLNHIFYQLNIDFTLLVEIEIEPNVYEYFYLEEGHITDFGVNIVIKKVLTFWAGICYKITFDFDTFQKVTTWTDYRALKESRY